MATTAEIVYDVKEMLKMYSDDIETSDSYIKYLYNIKRSKYLRRELNNLQRTVDNSVLQTLCVDLELVSANECSVSFDCEKILRSTQPIPKPIDLHMAPALMQVKPSVRTEVPFNFISKERAAYASASPFDGVYAFLDPDGHLYVYSKSDIKLLRCLVITGVFEDPFELKNYTNVCGGDITEDACYDDKTTEYPLQAHLIDLIKTEIVSELAKRETVKEDKENDAEES